MFENYALVFGVCVLVCLCALCYFIVGYLHAASGCKQVCVLPNILNSLLLLNLHTQLGKLQRFVTKTSFIETNFTGFRLLMAIYLVQTNKSQKFQIILVHRVNSNVQYLITLVQCPLNGIGLRCTGLYFRGHTRKFLMHGPIY